MKKILVIEDESVLQTTIRDVLEKENHYTIISALDGESGLNLAQKEKPDLILLDLILPKLHGLDVLRKLKESEETKNISVIVLTNVEGIKEVEEAIELGAMTYLVKAHYDLREVVDKIKKALGE